MVKSGKFQVSQGSTAGRIGEGLGKGLAESIPKEAAQYRLSQGLKDFAKNANGLSPLEAAAQAYSIPGITPQMAQALPELLRLQQQRQAYSNRGQIGQQPSPEENFKGGGIGSQGNEPRNLPQQNQMVQPNEFGQPQIVEENPLREEAVPKKAWGNDRFNEQVSENLETGKAFTVPEAISLAKEQEARELGQPESVQRIDEYLRNQEATLINNLDERLNTLLQTENKEEKFENLSGEEQNNLRRSANRELRTNPRATIEDISNKYANIGLEMAKTKKRLDAIANQGVLDRLAQPESRYDQLKEFSKIFKDSGNSEIYDNLLRQKFGLSRPGSAAIAFERSPEVKKYISKPKDLEKLSPEKISIESRNIASNVENLIDNDDSILAIARELKSKNPYFDTYSFFSQLREDQERLGLNGRQKREISEGMGSGIPTWADLTILPWGK